MVITLTPITENQLRSTAKVALWLGGSVLVSWGLAYVTGHPGLLGTSAPLINLVGVTLSKFFQEEEADAEKSAPKVVDDVANDVAPPVQ